MTKKAPLARKLTFGIFYLLSSTVATVGLNVVIVGFVARKLGVENFGLYSTIISFVGLFQFLSDLGLNRTLLKHGSINISNAQFSFGNALFLKTFFIIPTFILVTGIGFFSGYRGNEIILIELFTLTMVLDSFGTVFSSIRRILGDFKLVSFFRIVKALINLIIVVIALSMSNSVLYLAIASVVLNAVTFVISLINSILLLKPKLKLGLIKEFFADSAIFSLSDFFVGIYAKISTVLLSFYTNFHTVGIFSAAIKFTNIANLFPNQIRFALLPTMYRILEDPKIKESNDHKRVFKIIFKYTIILATPFVILIFLFSDPIIHLIFGRKYDLSIPFVKLFSIFIYFRFVQSPFKLIYVAMHKNKQMVLVQAVTALTDLVLTLLLIPSYKAFGAAVAAICSEGLFLFIVLLRGAKYSIWKFKDVVSMMIKPTFSGFICMLAAYYFLNNKVNLFLQIFFVLLIYLLVLFVVRTFNRDDKELFVKIFMKKNVIAS